MLAHGALLRKNFFNADQIIAIVRDFRNSGLSDEEVAVMSFAQKVTLDPHGTDEEDFDMLRRFGLSDEEIMDVLLACTARNFFSKTLDAIGAVPDDIYHELEPELQEALIRGRKF